MQYAPWFAAGLLMLAAAPAQALNGEARRQALVSIYQHPIHRNYHDTSHYPGMGRAIALEGTPEQIMRLSGWLDRIARVPYGMQTLAAIFSSGNRVTIRHSSWALAAAGRTLAPLSPGLTDGHGADVTILFDVRIPDQGSHHVFDRAGRPLAFTAVENLFHELAHARHQTNGNWRYWDSEGQAIEDENRFRRELALGRGEPPPRLRSGIDGEQTWWPSTRAARVSW